MFMTLDKLYKVIVCQTIQTALSCFPVAATPFREQSDRRCPSAVGMGVGAEPRGKGGEGSGDEGWAEGGGLGGW